MKQRKQYTKEFKEGAVRLVTEQKRSYSDAAKSLGISPWTLSKWVNAAGSEGVDAFRGNGNRSTVEQENIELRRQIKQLEEERAILKKAAAYFARHIE
jgi:transposase